MSLSKLAHEIHESSTLKLNEKAARLRERGEPVIHLGSGEPKSEVPVGAINSCNEKLQTASIRYTPTEGIPSLIDAIIRFTEESYHKVVGPDNVIVSHGAKHALYNILMAIINPDDEVIINAPYWVSYPEIIRMMRGASVIVPPESGSFHPRIEDITSAVSSRTKAIIINSPNNPSGTVYSENFIGQIVQLCEQKGIYLITDDIYQKLVFNGKSAVSCYNYSTDHSDRSKLIVINGVSKMYAMTGFRIGWTIANRELCAAMARIQAQNISCPSELLQSAAVGALTGPQTSVDELRSTLQKNRDIMMNELKTFSGLRTVEPEGTFYCLPDFSSYSNNSTELSNFLLEKALVVTVPGCEFGMEGHLRLSYCGSENDITEGIARIKWALDSDSPAKISIGKRILIRDW